MKWWKQATGGGTERKTGHEDGGAGKQAGPEDVRQAKLPTHIAIIMDGNGRWAVQRGLPRSAGHKAGTEALRRIVQECHRLKIPYLTVYAFSTENWRRPAGEIKFLMQLLLNGLQTELEELDAAGVRVRIIGDLAGLPHDLQQAAAESMRRTRDNTGLHLQIALNYGGRAEIVQACRRVAAAVKEGELRLEDVDETVFSSFLYTSGVPDPDLIIRTGGEFRLSNFLLWQAAYAELWVSDIYWPEFDEEALHQAIQFYLQRERRFGGLSKGSGVPVPIAERN